MHQTLVLCGGGPDAIVAGAILQSCGHKITFLYFDYGQRAFLNERRAVMDCAYKMQADFRIISLNCFDPIKSSLLKSGPPVPDKADMKGYPAFVPARNTVLLSIAAGIAESDGFDRLCIGNIAGGTNPDNSVAFAAAFNMLLPHAVRARIALCNPVNEMTKEEVIARGLTLNVPLTMTWSCYWDGPIHCGVCASCVPRRAAFIKLGINEEYEA